MADPLQRLAEATRRRHALERAAQVLADKVLRRTVSRVAANSAMITHIRPTAKPTWAAAMQAEGAGTEPPAYAAGQAVLDVEIAGLEQWRDRNCS